MLGYRNLKKTLLGPDIEYLKDLIPKQHEYYVKHVLAIRQYLMSLFVLLKRNFTCML